jgi:hypothetical protein
MIFTDLDVKTAAEASLSGSVSQIHLMIFTDLIVKTVAGASVSGLTRNQNLMEFSFCIVKTVTQRSLSGAASEVLRGRSGDDALVLLIMYLCAHAGMQAQFFRGDTQPLPKHTGGHGKNWRAQRGSQKKLPRRYLFQKPAMGPGRFPGRLPGRFPRAVPARATPPRYVRSLELLWWRSSKKAPRT